jgi:hypothetical protein
VDGRSRLCGTLWPGAKTRCSISLLSRDPRPLGNATDCALRWSVNACSIKAYGELIARWPGSFSASLREIFSLYRSRKTLATKGTDSQTAEKLCFRLDFSRVPKMFSGGKMDEEGCAGGNSIEWEKETRLFMEKSRAKTGRRKESGYQIPLSLPVIFCPTAAAVASHGSRLSRALLCSSPFCSMPVSCDP